MCVCLCVCVCVCHDPPRHGAGLIARIAIGLFSVGVLATSCLQSETPNMTHGAVLTTPCIQYNCLLQADTSRILCADCCLCGSDCWEQAESRHSLIASNCFVLLVLRAGPWCQSAYHATVTTRMTARDAWRLRMVSVCILGRWAPTALRVFGGLRAIPVAGRDPVARRAHY